MVLVCCSNYITHMRRDSQLFHTANAKKLGRGLGTRLTKKNSTIHLFLSTLHTESIKHALHRTLPLLHFVDCIKHEEIYRALSYITILQVTESWVQIVCNTTQLITHWEFIHKLDLGLTG